MNKTITKVFLSLSMCLCYTAGNVSNIHAASLNTSGVKTEYEMLELQRNKGNSGSSNILSNGDLSGSILFLEDDHCHQADDTLLKLATTAALFFGKQMEP